MESLSLQQQEGSETRRYLTLGAQIPRGDKYKMLPAIYATVNAVNAVNKDSGMERKNQ